MAGGGGMSGNSRPTGVQEKDSLKDFHQTLAVQATSQQVAEFQILVKSTEAAKAELQAFLRLGKENSLAESTRRDGALDRALENAWSENKKFLDGFSSKQKSGLKEITKRLTKADSGLEQEEKELNQSFDANLASSEVAAYAENLDKVLTDFSNQQLTLGREMNITLASGQDLAFTLPPIKNQVTEH